MPDTYSLLMLGSVSQLQLPVSQSDYEGKQSNLYRVLWSRIIWMLCSENV